MLYGNKASFDLLNQYQAKLGSRDKPPVMTPVRAEDSSFRLAQAPSNIHVDPNQNLERFNNLDALYNHNPYMRKKVSSRQLLDPVVQQAASRQSEGFQMKPLPVPTPPVDANMPPFSAHSSKVSASAGGLAPAVPEIDPVRNLRRQSQELYNSPKVPEQAPSPFKAGFGSSPFTGFNSNFMPMRRAPKPVVKETREEEKMTFQEKMLLNLVEGLQNQREFDLKRKNQDLMDRIERLEKNKQPQPQSSGFMQQDPNASQLKQLTEQVARMQNMLDNPYRGMAPWMSGAQPNGFQNPQQQAPAQGGFQNPVPQPAQISNRPPKKVKYHASTPPPDDSDEQRLKVVQKRRIQKAIRKNDRVADKMLKGLDLPSDAESDGSFQEKLRNIDEISKEKREKERQKKKEKFDEIVERFERRNEQNRIQQDWLAHCQRPEARQNSSYIQRIYSISDALLPSEEENQ